MTKYKPRKKVEALRWLAASFILARPISGLAQPSCSTFRSFKKTPKKTEFTFEMSYQYLEALRWPQTVPSGVCELTGRTKDLRFNLRVSRGWPHIAATTASGRLQNKSYASLKSRVTTRVGERFEIQTNVTTLKTADIFRNRSASLCSKAHTYMHKYVFTLSTIYISFRI